MKNQQITKDQQISILIRSFWSLKQQIQQLNLIINQLKKDINDIKWKEKNGTIP